MVDHIPWGWGVLPYKGNIGKCSPKGYGFLIHFSHKDGLVLHSSLGMFLEESTFSSLSMRPLTKCEVLEPTGP